MEEIEREIRSKLSGLERRIEVESSRRWAIHKCQRDIEKLRQELANSSHWTCVSPHPTESKRLIPRRGLPSYPKYTLSLETIKALKRPTFNLWQWAPNEMLSCIEYMFHDLGLVHEFSIDGVTLKRWLLSVQGNYRDNPFHNWRHSFCVTQMMHGMIHLCRLQDHLSPTENLILMIAAVCHDLDHPGLDNTYQVNARTDLALRYGNHSPLERHHCAVTLELLSRDETNILSAMEPGASDEIQKGVMELILATDMARHVQIMASFSQCVEIFDFQNLKHLRLLEQVLIKCCDTSNEVRPPQISEPWLDFLLQEYFMQAVREKMEGLPVSPHMDPEKVSKSGSQVVFLTSVLIPMFESLTQIFPQLEATMVHPLRGARDHYRHLEVEEARRLLSSTPSEGTVAV
ncbi:high affinity cGMP-specific 3',5'-cyclic phosphodiesterase 9A-like [Narcine bancroftii]|uniref:high affinity cGMP-specific 3',5'-cyclic phosphodiesterase 9A-like n=1 Tax=Narcine bancroftii TaxID=1343680 RepID=UPI003831648D